MVNLAVDQQYVASLASNIALLNSNAYSNYQQAFANFQLGGATGDEPAPPQLMVLNTALALQLVVAYDNAWASATTTSGAPKLDLTSAITFVQAAPIQPPVPVPVPAPNDPVGPAQGVANSAGQQMYYTVTGDTSPNGTVFSDTRGTFVKVVIATPFGNEAYWEKVA